MTRPRPIICVLIAAVILAPLAGCAGPGESKGRRTGGAIIGGLAGVAAGALLGGNSQIVGGLIGGALGAGGGYLIGTHMDKSHDRKAAREAARRAEEHPAKPEDVYESRTADLNRDGFVTLDEVVAMRDAGLSDEDMAEWLRLSGQTFVLSAKQERFLRERGVSDTLIAQLPEINRERMASHAEGG